MMFLHFVWSKCNLNRRTYSAQKQEFAWKHIDLKTYRSAVKHRSEKVNLDIVKLSFMGWKCMLSVDTHWGIWITSHYQFVAQQFPICYYFDFEHTSMEVWIHLWKWMKIEMKDADAFFDWPRCVPNINLTLISESKKEWRKIANFVCVW